MKAYKSGKRGFKAPYIPIVSVFLIFIFFSECSPTEPDNKLELTLEDVSCTEAWLKVNGETGSEITLNRDDKEVQRFTLTTSPQTVYDNSLLPNKTYTYQAFIQPFNQSQIASNEITVTTLDTTSHDFTWQTFTFGGEKGSSSFYDCAIISENNIWCVGEIFLEDTYTYDSLGNWIEPYNAVHWNGNEWELKRIYYYENGLNSWGPIGTIYAFNQNDIWFGLNIHWNGQAYEHPITNTSAFWGWSINKFWGTSSNDLYAVGNNGNIAHYQNGVWTKIESGTELPIRDIWGDFNVKTNRYEILSIAAEVDVNRGSKVLRIDGSAVTEESNKGMSWDVGGLWFKSGSKYYIAGAGIHYKHSLNDSIWNRYPQGLVTNYVGYGIKGGNINDVFATGSFLEIAHFNGVSWHNYSDKISSPSGAVGRMSIKGNLIVTVGGEGRSALVVIGRRN